MPAQMTDWPVFDPGRMVHKINIQKPVANWDDSGPVMKYETFLTTWAALEPVRGTDVIQGGQITTQLYITVTMAYQKGINASHRVNCAKGNFIIQSAENPLERDVLLVLNCVELGDKDTA
jgi:SPP1 family predicted phage head-tail adaptor